MPPDEKDLRSSLRAMKSGDVAVRLARDSTERGNLAGPHAAYVQSKQTANP
jgi:hypothetical protein